MYLIENKYQVSLIFDRILRLKFLCEVNAVTDYLNNVLNILFNNALDSPSQRK